MSTNPKLKKNGGEGTQVGNFLRSINFKKGAEVVSSLMTGNIAGAFDVIADKDNGMSDVERDFALTVMKLDIEEMKGVTGRLSSDMTSDSYLSKNVRPLTLIYLTIATTILIFLDFYHGKDLDVPGEWIDLLKSLLLGIYIAYFGSRGIEKYKAISNK
jgi:hypothetical protein